MGRTMNAYDLNVAKHAIVRVGEGRGFIVQGDRDDRYVITAAHLLFTLPPYHPACEAYECLIGPLESDGNHVWADLFFLDPIADIAVLGALNSSAGRRKAYWEFVRSRPAMRAGDAKRESKAWLSSPDGNWQSCSVGHKGDGLWISDAVNGIVRGMSGSPIVLDGGSAVGIVNCFEETEISQNDANARLVMHLPGWLLRELKL
jgi:hypothetical protein